MQNNLLFVALSPYESVRRTIYNDIIQDLSSHFNKIHVICLGKKSVFSEGNLVFYSGNLLNWISYFFTFFKYKITDVLITDFFIGGFMSVLFSKFKHIPLVYRCGGPWVNDYFSFKNLVKKMIIFFTKPFVIKNCELVVYNSKSVIQKYDHEYSVVYNGVDVDLFKPMFAKKITSKLNILFIGRVNKEKGLDYLFEAMSEFYDDVHLGIVGDGPDFEKYKFQNLRVRFYGNQSKIELPNIINQYDLVVLPSLVESFPNVLLEAMSCGKPVIATNVWGIPEMVTDDVGILIPPKDSDAISWAIKVFLNDSSLILKMGKAARKKIIIHFEKNEQLKKLRMSLFK